MNAQLQPKDFANGYDPFEAGLNQHNTPSNYLAHEAHMSLDELAGREEFFLNLSVDDMVHVTATLRILAECQL